MAHSAYAVSLALGATVLLLPERLDAQRAMALADWYRVVNVSTPAVSPDGRRVAVTVTRAVEGENKRHSEV